MNSFHSVPDAPLEVLGTLRTARALFKVLTVAFLLVMVWWLAITKWEQLWTDLRGGNLLILAILLMLPATPWLLRYVLRIANVFLTPGQPVLWLTHTELVFLSKGYLSVNRESIRCVYKSDFWPKRRLFIGLKNGEGRMIDLALMREPSEALIDAIMARTGSK